MNAFETVDLPLPFGPAKTTKVFSILDIPKIRAESTLGILGAYCLRIQL